MVGPPTCHDVTGERPRGINFFRLRDRPQGFRDFDQTFKVSKGSMLAALREKHPEVARATICKGMRGAIRTPRGLEGRDVLASYLQKCIRRGLVEDGVVVVREWLLLALPDVPEDARNVRAVTTNLLYRLMISSVEDCLHAGIYPDVLRLAREFDEDREGARGFAAATELFVLLARADKGRLPSVMKLYRSPPSPSLPQAASFRAEFPQLYPSAGADASHAKTFEGLMRAGDIACIRLVDSAEARDAAWRTLRAVVGELPDAGPALRVVDALNAMWRWLVKKNHAEAYLVLYQAIALATFREGIESWSALPAGLDKGGKGIRDEAAVSVILDSHLADPTRVVAPDFAFDMHTRLGRGMKRGAAHFAAEGARIENQSNVVDAARMTTFTAMYVASKALATNAGVVGSAGWDGWESKKKRRMPTVRDGGDAGASAGRRKRKAEGGKAARGHAEREATSADAAEKEAASADAAEEEATSAHADDRGGASADADEKGDASADEGTTDSPAAKRQRKVRSSAAFFGGAECKRLRTSCRMVEVVPTLAPAHAQGCGSKPMTYSTVLDGEDVVVKRAQKGDDTAVVFDACKPLFGLRSNGARYVRMPCEFLLERSKGAEADTDVGDVGDDSEVADPAVLNVHRHRTDSGLKTYRVVKTSKANPGLYVVAKRHANVRMVVDSDKGDFRRDPSGGELLREYVKIGLVRAMFGVTDFNEHNVLYDAVTKALYSIDENRMDCAPPTAFVKYLQPKKSGVRKAAFKAAVDAALASVLGVVRGAGFEAALRSAVSGTGVVPAKRVDKILDVVKAGAERIASLNLF